MISSTLTLWLVLLGVGAVFSEQATFEGYELLSVYVRDGEDLDVLLQIGDEHPEVDFWREPASERNTTILVPPSFVREFTDEILSRGIPLTVLSDDVQSIVDAGNERTPDDEVDRRRQATGQVIDHANYHTYARILGFLTQLTAKYANIRVTNLNYKTYEKRYVAVVKLTGSAGTNKPVIIVEAGIHAREWISPATNLWFIEKVLSDYAAGDATARSLLDKYDWYVVPVTNPDGYEYTHSTQRLWRRNRRQFRNGCEGVDLNRNFDVQFGTTGVSNNCSWETYPGTSAFSEPETKNIRDLFNGLINSVVAYVSVHSFAQMVLVPWGYTKYVSRPPNYVELDRVTKLMTTAISNKHGRTYLHGTAFQLVNYAASGASEDWALTRKPGIIALCFELRHDTQDKVGFALPPSEIIATGEEFYSSLIVMANQIKV